MVVDGDAPVEGFDNSFFAVVGLRVTVVVGAEAAGAGDFVVDAGLLKQRLRMLCLRMVFGCCPGSDVEPQSNIEPQSSVEPQI